MLRAFVSKNSDRLFNACDETADQFAAYTLALKPKVRQYDTKGRKSYTLTLKWDGVNGKEADCGVFIGKSKKAALTLPLQNASRNGLSYIHLISTAEKPDAGILIHGVEAKVNGKSVADTPKVL